MLKVNTRALPPCSSREVGVGRQVKEEVMQNGPAVLQKVPFCRNCSASTSFAGVLMIVLGENPSLSPM